jgi:hypothetical protein
MHFGSRGARSNPGEVVCEFALCTVGGFSGELAENGGGCAVGRRDSLGARPLSDDGRQVKLRVADDDPCQGPVPTWWVRASSSRHTCRPSGSGSPEWRVGSFGGVCGGLRGRGWRLLRDRLRLMARPARPR